MNKTELPIGKCEKNQYIPCKHLLSIGNQRVILGTREVVGMMKYKAE